MGMTMGALRHVREKFCEKKVTCLGFLSHMQCTLVKFWTRVAISEPGPDIVGRVPGANTSF